MAEEWPPTGPRPCRSEAGSMLMCQGDGAMARMSIFLKEDLCYLYFPRGGDRPGLQGHSGECQVGSGGRTGVGRGCSEVEGGA